MSDFKIAIKHFNELTLNELYDVIALREKVFIIEQNCPYQECDEKDKVSYILLGTLNGKVIATIRILPKGVSYPSDASIGRVVVDADYRDKSYGHDIMNESLSFIKNTFLGESITISAQLYLKKFYSSHGFEQVSDVYLEDNIDHIKMHLPNNKF